MATKNLDREIGLNTEIVGLTGHFEETGLFNAPDPLATRVKTWATARSVARLSGAIGLIVAISIGKYLLNLNDSLSGPPLTQRERNRLATGPWEKYSRHRIYN